MPAIITRSPLTRGWFGASARALPPPFVQSDRWFRIEQRGGRHMTIHAWTRAGGRGKRRQGKEGERVVATRKPCVASQKTCTRDKGAGVRKKSVGAQKTPRAPEKLTPDQPGRPPLATDSARVHLHAIPLVRVTVISWTMSPAPRSIPAQASASGARQKRHTLQRAPRRSDRPSARQPR